MHKSKVKFVILFFTAESYEYWTHASNEEAPPQTKAAKKTGFQNLEGSFGTD